MRVGLEQTADEVRVSASGRLTVSEAPRLHRALLEAFASGRAVRLRLSDEVETDLSLLQLLCAARRTAAARGTGFCVDGLEEAGQLRRVIARSGAARCAGCPEPCPWAPAVVGR